MQRPPPIVIALLFLLMCSGGRAASAVEDDALRQIFLQAERALQAGDRARYRELSEQLGDHPLRPYLIYSELSPRLDQADGVQVQDFLRRYGDGPLAVQLRRAWSNRLYAEGRWAELADLPAADTDAAGRCRRLYALHQTGRSAGALEQVEDLWLVGHSQPTDCDRLFAVWRDAGGLTPALIWRRIALAIQAGQPALARHLARQLPAADRPWVELWTELREQPARVAERRWSARDHPQAGAILAYAFTRWAGRDPQAAAAAWRDLKADLDPEHRAEAVRGIALGLASQANPQALEWLELAAGEQPDPRLAESAALTALRLGAWNQAEKWIARLPQQERESDRWIYWQGRSAQALGQHERAAELYARASRERSFYGFLAADRSAAPYNLTHRPLRPGDAELAAVAQTPGARRATELAALGRDAQARREWAFLLSLLPRQDLGAAAVLAHRQGWYDLAILALGRGRELDDLELRFPLAYREPILGQARSLALDPAWLFALARQESAFAQNARSSAGALGLMQLMPETARQVARRLDARIDRTADILDPDTNIRLGSTYLGRLLDQFGSHQALATAAYNAGPGRVRRWVPEEGAVPVDLWVESLPFGETREYLRRVSAYTVVYEHRLGQRPRRLSERMPDVPSRSRLGG